ncbi:hypothetical protein ACH3O9_07465 [Leeuwenhoekiella sp. A16]
MSQSELMFLIQYRFENIVDASEENEIRLVQQLEWEKENAYY